MQFPAAHALRYLAVLCLAAAIPAGVSADTIYLKNGRKIIASHVTQENGQVSYETSAGRMSFSLSIVDRIVHDDSLMDTVPGTPSDRAANLPIAPPNMPMGQSSDIANDAVRDGSIDTNLLSKLESEATARSSPTAVARVVAAESAAAQFEISVGDYEKAAGHYKMGLQFDPENLALLLQSAYLHLRRSEYSAAADLLERARRVGPDSPDVAKLTGWAYYGLNRVADAVSEWKRALTLKPDEEVKHALEKAERDAQEEAGYHEGETAHF